MAEHALGRSPAAIAKRLVTARRAGSPLDGFPGPIPGTLEEAYACQDAAIALWPDSIAGWKVGLIGPDLAPQLGADRLTGPIFAKSVRTAVRNGHVPFPVFVGGFAAVEAEYIFLLDADAPADKTTWTIAEARAIVRAVHVGVETAGSPLAAINDLGPRVIVSDFGNNAGLIIGPELDAWRERDIDDWRCETFVGGESVGRGSAAQLPGGPFESLRFLLGLNASRGRPLAAGDLVSSGAVTGVHDIEAGQNARIVFHGGGEILCTARPFARHPAAVEEQPG